jgi:hypothetical protein
MNKTLKAVAVAFALFLLLACAGCKKAPAASPENPLIGQWRDTYGLTEYEFFDDTNLKLTAIGIASFQGTYSIEEDQMTISYSVLGKEEVKTYDFRIEKDRFFLDKTEFERQ